MARASRIGTNGLTRECLAVPRDHCRRLFSWPTKHCLVPVLAVISLAIGQDAAMAQQLLSPSGAFVQVGTAKQTREVTTGFVWDWSREWGVGPGLVTGYWEASLSRWSYPNADGRRAAWLGQVGLIPVFRYRPTEGTSAWFIEGGIGLTFMTTIYQTDRRQFSTSFNFGDHIAVGRDFGAKREHELALRLEHFSNAGIKHPNPGENFAQVRYSFRFE
jgi:hypothetical protein